MKKLLIGAAVIGGVVVAGAIVLPSLVPADRIKDEVVAQVKAATGRDLTIQGKVAVSVFPSLAVQVGDVALSNPPGYSSKDFVRLGALDVELKLLPLLSGKVEVDSFVLIDPLLNLETDRKGRPNWQFETAKSTEPAGAAQPQAQGGAAGGGPADLSLGEVKIKNGKLRYVDGAAGTTEEISAINLDVSLKSLDAPLAGKGSLTVRGKPIELALAVARPRSLTEGKTTPAELAVSSDIAKLSFKGEAGGAEIGLRGDLDTAIPSVRALAEWASGKPLTSPAGGLGPFALKGKLSAAGSKIALDGASINLDQIAATGRFAVETGGARPSLKGALDIAALDVTPYLPPEDNKPAASAPAAAGGSAAPADWSDEPIDASGLKAADLDFTLTLGSLTVRKIKIGKTALHLTNSNGRAVVDLSGIELYQGAGKGRLALDGSQPGIGLEANFTLKNLAAEPFLTDVADFKRLEGTGNADIQVSGRGKTERQLVSSLDGRGQMAFTDGAIKGINLAEMMRNVTTAFSDNSGDQKTDFSELSGSFTIADGIVSNQDLAMKSPLLRVEGKGTVELPPRTVHYRVTPKAVASLQGQGGATDLGGVQVPVMIEGPWHKLSYRPDLAALATGKAGQALQGVLGKLPGGQATPTDVSQPQSQKPLSLSPSSLFGR